ncbi:MAG: hypothetical protein WBB28_15840 [Crinalium sp.]
MGLMSKLFGGKVNTDAPGQLANGGNGQLANNGSHNLDANKVLATTDSAVPTPTNADFSSIRSAPVLTKPKYFTKQEAEALKSLAKEKRIMAEASRGAYNALKNIDNADTEVHGLHRRYQGKIARNELEKQQSNAELAKKLHNLRPGYAELHSQVETANVAATNAINAIRNSYGS